MIRKLTTNALRAALCVIRYGSCSRNEERTNYKPWSPAREEVQDASFNSFTYHTFLVLQTGEDALQFVSGLNQEVSNYMYTGIQPSCIKDW